MRRCFVNGPVVVQIFCELYFILYDIWLLLLLFFYYYTVHTKSTLFYFLNKINKRKRVLNHPCSGAPFFRGRRVNVQPFRCVLKAENAELHEYALDHCRAQTCAVCITEKPDYKRFLFSVCRSDGWEGAAVRQIRFTNEPLAWKGRVWKVSRMYESLIKTKSGALKVSFPISRVVLLNRLIRYLQA